jgi:hypothetical protein
LQAEGWTVESFNCEFEHYQKHDKDPRIPVLATVTVTLVPVR